MRHRPSEKFWSVLIVLTLTVAFGFLWGVKAAEIIAAQNEQIANVIEGVNR